jgi:hypothetical protein
MHDLSIFKIFKQIDFTSMKTRITIAALLLILCLEGMNAFGWSGSGTQSDPYQIATAADLATLATNVNNGDTYYGIWFKLMNDISLSGYSSWVSIGLQGNPFCGNFMGNYKTITGLTINNPSDEYNGGLFGLLGGGTVIMNLTISGCNITIGTDYAKTGGLAAAAIIDMSSNFPTIQIYDCHTSGSITATGLLSCAGGLIGIVSTYESPYAQVNLQVKLCSSSAAVSCVSTQSYPYDPGTNCGGLIGVAEGDYLATMTKRPYIKFCHSSGPVINNCPDGSAGGLIGTMINSVVADCYSRSAVTVAAGNACAGGLAGLIKRKSWVQLSYSTGFVSPGTAVGFIGINDPANNGINSVTDCYWDTQTSGQSSSTGGGSGRTTAQMKDKNTFTGWDFTEQWAMTDTVNNAYPYLPKDIVVWQGSISSDWNTAGNWMATGSWMRYVPPPGATVRIYVGTYSPVISQGPSSPVLCTHLKIDPGIKLTIASGSFLTVQGMTYLNGGENLVIETEGSFIDNGITGSGTTKVKHDLSGNRWWYIGSPMTNATAGSFGTLSPTPNTGTRLFSWNEPTNAYVNITDGSAALAPMKGYSYKNFTGANIATFPGALNSGWIGADNNLTFTSGGANAGYNLVCNPFPSAINWGSPAHPATGITRTGIDSTIWYRTNSTYSTYNSTSGTGTGSPVGQPYIPAMQGFWVHVSDAASGQGTLKIGNGARVHNSQPFYKSIGEQNIFRLFVSRDTLKDDIAVGFYEQALPGFDPYDSEKRFNDAAYPHLFTFTSDNHVVVINGQPLLLNQDSLTIPLGFGTAVAGVFTMEATNMNEFDPGLSVYLLDKQGGFRQDLRENNSFTFQSELAGPDAARFSLYFSKKGSGETELTDQPAVHIYSAGSMLYIDVLAGGPAKAELYNLLGQKVLGRQVEHGLNQIEVNCLNGVYIARVLMGDKIVMKKIILWK